MKLKSYARLVSEELGIEYDKVLKLTLEEVDAIVKSRYDDEMEKRLNDKDARRKIQLTLNDFDYFYEKLGEALYRAFLSKEETSYFEWTGQIRGGVNYEDPEIKRLLYDESRKSRNYYSNSGCYLNMRSFSYLHEIFENAIKMRFPSMIKYKPDVYGYGGYRREYRNADISFTVIRYMNEDNEEETKDFTCSVEAFLNGDWDQMLEDYLEYKDFSKVTSKEDGRYIVINDFLNSPEMAEFIENVKNMYKSS